MSVQIGVSARGLVPLRSASSLMVAVVPMELEAHRDETRQLRDDANRQPGRGVLLRGREAVPVREGGFERVDRLIEQVEEAGRAERRDVQLVVQNAVAVFNVRLPFFALA